MGDWSPLTVRRAWVKVPRPWRLLGATLLVLVTVYATVVLVRPLLTLVPVAAVAGTYLLWRLLVAVEAIADAQQRLAARRPDGRPNRGRDGED